MTDKVKQALAEVEQKARAFSAATQGETADEILTQMRGEEPASEDLDEEMHRYFKEWMGDPVDVARHFANWQKQQLMKDAVDCDVVRRNDGYASLCWKDIDGFDKSVSKFSNGDKVKLIILRDTTEYVYGSTGKYVTTTK